MIVKKIANVIKYIFPFMMLLLCGCNNSTQSISRQTFAMDTFMTIEVWGDNAEQASEDALAEIERIDKLWDIGSSDSEISQLNSNSDASVSDDTIEVIGRAATLYEETNGSIDITVYPLMELWGFTSQNYKVPDCKDINACLSHIGMSNISIDKESNTVKLSNGAKLDFGCVAKGYTSDTIKNILLKDGINSALLNLGGNIYAIGSKINGQDWVIGIENPDADIFSGSNYIGAVSLSDKALVTSGDYKRFFIEDGQKYHHIMNPQTGYPADSGLISVSIVSSDGTLADALSTALFVMGKEKALAYWSEHSNSFDAILVEKDGTITVTEGLKDTFKSDFAYEVANLPKLQ